MSVDVEDLMPAPPDTYTIKEVYWGKPHPNPKWGVVRAKEEEEKGYERARKSLYNAIMEEVEHLLEKDYWTPDEYYEYVEKVREVVEKWEAGAWYEYMTPEGRKKFRSEVVEATVEDFVKHIKEKVYSEKARDKRIRDFEEFMYKKYPEEFRPYYLQICDYFFSNPDLVKAYAEGRKAEVYDVLEENTGYSRSTVRKAFYYMRKAGII